MSKANKRKSGGDTASKSSNSSSASKDSQKRPSVFERLGTKTSTGNSGSATSCLSVNTASAQSETFCRHWAQNGTCPYGKTCKLSSTHILISPSKRNAKKESDSKQSSGGRSLEEKRLHSTVIRKSPEVNWESWDQTELEYEDEKALEKRRQLLQRELELQMKKDTRKQDPSKRRSSSTSSCSSSSSASSSSSGSSSTSSVTSQARKRLPETKKKRQSTSSPSSAERNSKKTISAAKMGYKESPTRKMSVVKKPVSSPGRKTSSSRRKSSMSPVRKAATPPKQKPISNSGRRKDSPRGGRSGSKHRSISRERRGGRGRSPKPRHRSRPRSPRPRSNRARSPDRKKDDDRSRKDDLPRRDRKSDFRDKRDHDDARSREKARDLREAAREKERMEALERCRERQREREQIAKEKERAREEREREREKLREAERERDRDRDRKEAAKRDYERELQLREKNKDRDRLNTNKDRKESRDRYDRLDKRSGLDDKLDKDKRSDRDHGDRRGGGGGGGEKSGGGGERERSREKERYDRERSYERVSLSLDKERERERERERDRERERERERERGGERSGGGAGPSTASRDRKSVDRARSRDTFDSRPFDSRRLLPDDKPYTSPYRTGGERGRYESDRSERDRVLYKELSPTTRDEPRLRLSQPYPEERRMRRDRGWEGRYEETSKSSRDWDTRDYSDNRREWDTRTRRGLEDNESGGDWGYSGGGSSGGGNTGGGTGSGAGVSSSTEWLPRSSRPDTNLVVITHDDRRGIHAEEKLQGSGDSHNNADAAEGVKRGREEGDSSNEANKRPRVEEPPLIPASNILEEELSDISDGPDEILNREDVEDTYMEEAVQDGASEVAANGNIPEGNHTVGAADETSQPPHSNQTLMNIEQRLLEPRITEEEVMDNLDFEEISDEELEEEAKANKGSLGDALGVDWASLVAECRQSSLGSNVAQKRGNTSWTPINIFKRTGVSLQYAGPELYAKIQESLSQENGDDKLLNPVAGIHRALTGRTERRKTLFTGVAPLAKRALSARTDIAIRRQLCCLPIIGLESQPAVGICQWVV